MMPRLIQSAVDSPSLAKPLLMLCKRPPLPPMPQRGRPPLRQGPTLHPDAPLPAAGSETRSLLTLYCVCVKLIRFMVPRLTQSVVDSPSLAEPLLMLCKRPPRPPMLQRGRPPLRQGPTLHPDAPLPAAGSETRSQTIWIPSGGGGVGMEACDTGRARA